MKPYQVRLYKKEDFDIWNAFISVAKNATFLFNRGFMDYHKDRFQDFSLLIFDDEKLVAVLPANRVVDCVFSHYGLTYGGLVFSTELKLVQIEQLLFSVLNFLKNENISTLTIKSIPSFYDIEVTTIMSDLMLKLNAQSVVSELSLAIDYSNELAISKSKLKHNRRISAFYDLEIIEEDTLDNFWELVLIPRLLKKYNSNPVHSLSEINMLKGNFPNNIRQFSLFYENEIVAGITVFETGSVIKSQYGATTDKGEKIRALDYLFLYLIDKYKKEEKLFFDMGTVTSDGKINSGLLNQKLELGCRKYYHNIYELKL